MKNVHRYVAGRRSARAAFSAVIGLLAIAATAPPAVADAGTVTIYPAPNSRAGVYGVTVGPDGNIWYAGAQFGIVGKMTPAGVFTDYQTSIRDVRYVAGGPDGNVWFTEYGDAGAIGRVTPDGVITEFPVPTLYNRPYSIAAGPDGNMWFTEDGNKIGRITMAGAVTEFTIPSRQALPDRIAVGPDGAMWFSEGNVDKLGRISPQGRIKEYKLPDGTFPSGLVTGPDGKLWVASQAGPPGKILRVDVSGSKLAVTEFPVPDPKSIPFNITTGPDGNLWFTDVGAGPTVFTGQIGRITPAGVITMFDAQAPLFRKALADIIAGPGDGKIYYGFFQRPAAIASMTTA